MSGVQAGGAMLHVDLNAGRIAWSSIPLEVHRRFLGGRGMGVHLAAKEMQPTVDPLSPENLLIFCTGLLTGTGVPFASRADVVTKSPLTGTLTSANMGGQFGAALKRVGVEAILVKGASSRPVYLEIGEGDAELRDASAYWGMGTGETTDALRRDTGERNARIACIGPAGERLVRISCIVNERARAAGRGGVGAAMGSKRLKAVLVRHATAGADRPWDRDAAARIMEYAREKVEKSGILRGGLKRYGTASLVNLINNMGVLPTRNFQESRFEGAEHVSGEEMERTILVGRKGCYACPVGCGRLTRVDGAGGEGPEYETIWAFGPDCGIDDLKAIARANYLCNELGLDTISTGATIACAMEMAERGYLDAPLRFGDASLLEGLVRAIAWRTGIGDGLAEGSLRFATRLGHPELSMSVKGQEIPAYDPRHLQGQGLEYATSLRGACHVYGNMVYPEVLGIPVRLDPLSLERKAYWTKHMQDLSACLDSLGICLFSIRVFSPEDYAFMTSAFPGMEMGREEFMQIGERIWNLHRLFNIGAGFSERDDTLPARLLAPPQGEGRGWRREPLLGEYYRERGWSSEGIPLRETLERLGIAGEGSLRPARRR